METQRTQIIGPDTSRMIQVQDSRFIYNWKRGESGYPSYAATLEEFNRLYARFGDFVKSHDLGEIEENQWEVTYINHIVKGELWSSPSDWTSIFPWLNAPKSPFDSESMQCAWGLILPGERGRLHVKVYFGKITLDGPESIIVDLTARGIASKEFPVISGFEVGHAAIVQTFADITSESAHRYWRRTQ